MKNPNQDKNKTTKHTPSAPSRKHLSQLPLDPFGDAKAFTVILSNIGDTMEPEIFAGDRVVITKKKKPCSGEMVVGHLKSGHMIFGAFHTLHGGLYQIRCINPKYANAHYLREQFHWIYPVDFIQIMNHDDPRYARAFKKLEFVFDEE